MAKNLLIVESPAKAKTIGKYLGNDFVVASSIGHICDLPSRNSAIKIAETGENAWRFDPIYVIDDKKKAVVSELKKLAKEVDAIYLASDPDREGEAIAWHLKNVLESVAPSKPFYRVTYHEITKKAVCSAVENPHQIDMMLVDAQQARRILDRIVGYRVSPQLWTNIPCKNPKKLSAGRVQSVALRLLVERQREIDAFVPQTYFAMGVEAKKLTEDATFIAKLARIDGEKPSVETRQAADTMLLDLAGANLSVTDIKNQPKARHALPPFTTSTMTQAALGALNFSSKKAMSTAQKLYENGFITYMRTDSVNISDMARDAARDFIVANYGASFYPETPNFYKSKAGAQGAHEAIRPTDVALTPQLATNMDAAELKLYDLIWRRFVASQMASAQTAVKTISLTAQKSSLAHDYIFTASATEVTFEGFLKVMHLSLKKKDAANDEEEETDEVTSLPALTVGEALEATRWIADEKKTKGPAYYTEATLIKTLEENGVGRPSTYAATVERLKVQEYAKIEKRKFIPLERGTMVWNWLEEKWQSLFNVGYTADMEAQLDKIAEEGLSKDKMLSEFYEKFLVILKESEPPPPEDAKIDLVFELLDQVKTWKAPVTFGKRVYDDRAFVQNVRESREKKSVLTARQFNALVRLVWAYADQIPDAEQRLKEAGIGAGKTLTVQRVSNELADYCFGVMERIGNMLKNPFIKSLHEQYHRGSGLTMKQFTILAKTIGENAAALPDCEEIREKLSEYVPEGFRTIESDPVVPKLFELLETVTEWRPPARRGKKTYDDRTFIGSLRDQFERRQALSSRQLLALRRVAILYREKIPNYAACADELGLTELAKADEEHARTRPPKGRRASRED